MPECGGISLLSYWNPCQILSSGACGLPVAVVAAAPGAEDEAVWAGGAAEGAEDEAVWAGGAAEGATSNFV